MIDYAGQGIDVDVIAEEKFFNKDFFFSYSGFNKLLFSPKLFYDYYILKAREEKLDAHLIEGQLIHLLFLQKELFSNNYMILPGNLPTGNNKKIVEDIYKSFGSSNSELSAYESEILSLLVDMNLHQSLKTDEQRIEKVLSEDNKNYFKFLCEKEDKNVIDQNTYDSCNSIAQQLKINLEIRDAFLLDEEASRYNELYIKLDKFNDYNWGLHGYIDNLTVKDGIYRINDIKTTSKTLSEFPDSVDYYSYWLQAAIYTILVAEHFHVKFDKIEFNFCVIDKYKQVKRFPVDLNTLNNWRIKAEEIFKKANWHYTNRDFTLPYDIIHNNIMFNKF